MRTHIVSTRTYCSPNAQKVLDGQPNRTFCYFCAEKVCYRWKCVSHYGGQERRCSVIGKTGADSFAKPVHVARCGGPNNRYATTFTCCRGRDSSRCSITTRGPRIVCYVPACFLHSPSPTHRLCRSIRLFPSRHAPTLFLVSCPYLPPSLTIPRLSRRSFSPSFRLKGRGRL